MKQFFKSNAFKSVITLLCVLLISGIFLTIAYGFLEVTDEEKFNRKVGKLYDGKSVTATEQTIGEQNTSFDATIEKYWKVDVDGKTDYLVQASSQGKDGKVTTWVVVKMSDKLDAITGVGGVIIYDAAPTEFTNNISAGNLKKFSTDYKEGIVYNYGDENDPSYVKTGASMTFTAVCDAVNSALKFVQELLGGAKKDPFEGFNYLKYIDTESTTYEVKADESVEYNIVTKRYSPARAFTIKITVKNGAITDYKIVVNGSTAGEEGENYKDLMPNVEKILLGKELSYFTGLYGEDMDYKAIDSYDENGVHTGASTEAIGSKSTYLCMYAGAFATANYRNCIEASKEPVDPFEGLDFLNYIDTEKTSYEVKEDGSVEYSIVTKRYSPAKAFTVTITVKDGAITDYKIVVNGSTEGEEGENYKDLMPDVEKILLGKDISYFTGLYGDNMAYKAIDSYDENGVHTGASTEAIGSKSTYLCMYAGAFATGNYQKCLDKAKPPVESGTPEGGEE